MERQKGPESFYPLSSENKAEGWNHFLKYLPLLLDKNLPTQRALPIMHRLVTRGAESSALSEPIQFEAMVHLMTNNNPLIQNNEDFQGAIRPIKEYFDSIIRTKPEEIYTTHTINIAPANSPDTHLPLRFQIFMPFRGHLRQYGTQTIGKKQKEVVRSSHATPLYHHTGSGKELKKLFLGLTEGLRPLLNELCDTADNLMNESLKSGDLSAQLRAAAFLQLWGASVLHPFADANGRVFSAKLVLDLNRMGFPIKNMLGMGEIDEELKENAFAGLGPMFLMSFFDSAGLSFINPEEVRSFMKDRAAFHAYMSSLRVAIQGGIKQGIPKEGPLAQLIESGATCLKLCLSRDGYIDRSFYETNMPGIIAANKRVRGSGQ